MIPYRVRADGSVALYFDDIMTAVYAPIPHRFDDVASCILDGALVLAIAGIADGDELSEMIGRLPWRLAT